MRILLFAILIVIGSYPAQAQNELIGLKKTPEEIRRCKDSGFVVKGLAAGKGTESETPNKPRFATKGPGQTWDEPAAKIKEKIAPELPIREFFEPDKDSEDREIVNPFLDIDDTNSPPKRDRFHWKPAVSQSLLFLGIQHSLRLLQNKTVRELDGPFFNDWGNSVRNLSNWRDGDSFLTNYVAHPMQGAVTGRIFINNSDKSKKLTFGMTTDYWTSRLKTMAWSAAWSTQFELGPISEASIGNVGLYDRRGPNLMGWVDLVVTPVAGTGVIILEDIIDKYIVSNWIERKLKSRTRIKLYRTFITPFQSFTNVLGGKKPWHRDNR